MSAEVITVEARAEALRRILSAAAPSGAWEFSVWEEWPDAEPRILDTEAATRLGFSRPRDVRQLIESIWPETKRPHVRATVSRTQMPKGGTRETVVNEYWLTEAELLKLCARARTETAELILDEMIAVFMAVRRHLVGAVPVVAHERKLPRKARPALTSPVAPQLPAPVLRVALTPAQASTVERAARLAGESPEVFLIEAIGMWLRELDDQLQRRERVERDGAARPHTVVIGVTQAVHTALVRKAKELDFGNPEGAPALSTAAYVLLQMGIHLQAAHRLAAMVPSV